MVDIRPQEPNRTEGFRPIETTPELNPQDSNLEDISAKYPGEAYPGEVKDQNWQPPEDAQSVQHFAAGEDHLDGPDVNQTVNALEDPKKTKEAEALESLLSHEGTDVLTQAFDDQEKAIELGEL